MALLIHPCNLDMSFNNISNPLTWGHLFLVYHTKNPMLGKTMSLQLLPPNGAAIIILVGFNLGALMLPGDLKVLVMSPLPEGLILPNKVDMPCHIPISPKWGNTLSSSTNWAQIPNRGCTRMQTKLILECLMMVLGCM